MASVGPVGEWEENSVIATADWVRTYEDRLEYLEHLGGVGWFDAPRPRRWHRCQPQTRGFFHLRLTERCACGGVRLDGCGPWIERNQR